MKQILLMVFIASIFLASCNVGQSKKEIDEDKLGIIDADVSSVETNLKKKAEFSSVAPGTGERISRSFENAPPLIPHTTDGFFPITIKNNICLSCHMPDKVKVSGAIPIPQTHFTFLRPSLTMNNGKYSMSNSSVMNIKHGTFNKAYYNCSQCHVPQAEIKVNIENLFTPEFRAKNGLNSSNLKDKLNEGIVK